MMWDGCQDTLYEVKEQNLLTSLDSERQASPHFIEKAELVSVICNYSNTCGSQILPIPCLNCQGFNLNNRMLQAEWEAKSATPSPACSIYN